MSLLTTMVRRTVPALRMNAVKASAARRTVVLETLSEEETDYVEPEPRFTKDGAVIVDNVSFTLEWILSSPPPLHAFEESPSIILRPDQEE